MTKVISTQKHAKVLGRHTRLGLPFRWTIGGEPVDLETDGYNVRVWVTQPDGQTILGPEPATVAGDTAVYQLNVGDLAVASPASNGDVAVVAVAENGTNTLVSDGRLISVGDWGGADDYSPAE